MRTFPPSTKLDTSSELRRKLRENIVTYDPMTVEEKLEYLLSFTPQYKTYSVYLTQSGTTAPVVVSLLEDSIGSPVWTRVSGGTYSLTKTGAFIEKKTKPINAWGTDKAGNAYEMIWIDVDTLILKTYASTDLINPVDNILSNTEINIYVYGNI